MLGLRFWIQGSGLGLGLNTPEFVCHMRHIVPSTDCLSFSVYGLLLIVECV